MEAIKVDVLSAAHCLLIKFYFVDSRVKKYVESKTFRRHGPLIPFYDAWIFTQLRFHPICLLCFPFSTKAMTLDMILISLSYVALFANPLSFDEIFLENHTVPQLHERITKVDDKQNSTLYEPKIRVVQINTKPRSCSWPATNVISSYLEKRHGKHRQPLLNFNWANTPEYKY